MAKLTPKSNNHFIEIPLFAASPYLFLLFLCFLPKFIFAQASTDSTIQKQIVQLWSQDYPKHVLGKNYDQVIATINTIDSLSILVNDPMNRANAHWVKAMYSIVQGKWKELESTLNTWDFIVKELPVDSNQLSIMASLNYHYGSYHLYHWNHEAATYYFGKVVEAYRDSVAIDRTMLKDTYVNQGLVHRRLGDYQRAVDYYEQALRFIGKKNTVERAKVLQNIARALLQSEQPDKAEAYFYQAKSLIDTVENKSRRQHSIQSLIYRNIGEFHTTVTANLDSAHYYIQASFAKETDTLGLINSWQRSGLAFLKDQEFEQANTAFEKALDLGSQFFTVNHPELVETYFSIGRGFQQQKQENTTLTYFQKALTALNDDFKATNFTDNPTVAQIPIKELGIAILQNKANALTNIGYLEDALITYQLIDSLIDQKRLKDIISDESFFSFIGNTKIIYEAAIKTALALNEKEQAFLFAQKAHGLRLLQYVQHDIAKASGNLPDSLIAQERQYKIAIGNKERQLNSPEFSAPEKAVLKQELFEIEQAYAIFIKKLEQTYPTYFQLKYALPFTPLVELQRKVINKKSLLIEYFLGQQVLYAFAIRPEEIKVFELPLGERFKENVLEFKTLVSKNSDDQQRFVTYCKVARQLFQTTLQPILEAQKEDLNHLIIIPDEILNYISFAALLTEPVNPNGRAVNYYHLPYLIKSYTISYNYSSALFYDKNQNPKQLLLSAQAGFAPVFSGQNSRVRNLDSLLHNDREVVLIDSIIKGKVYLDTAATIQNFKKIIDSCKIAHLATHATCNDSLPLNSYIHFYDGILPIHDLYGLKNTLELVVLSACETGAGLLKKGEGILSFARAFMQAGCPSVITSLWKVNDRQTPELMEKLYLNLKDGLPKNEALSLAQRQYLNQAETLADTHPYYWANFILIGNTDKIDFSNTSGITWWKWLFGSLIILLLATYLKSVGKTA